jgi:hypothetical protein
MLEVLMFARLANRKRGRNSATSIRGSSQGPSNIYIFLVSTIYYRQLVSGFQVFYQFVMCIFDQHAYECGDFKWGLFRQQCARQFRTGKTCKMKLVMQTTFIRGKCKLCAKIDPRETVYARRKRVYRGGNKRVSTGKRQSRDLGRSFPSWK